MDKVVRMEGNSVFFCNDHVFQNMFKPGRISNYSALKSYKECDILNYNIVCECGKLSRKDSSEVYE